eukprot:m.8673 g.8673  ORF g.8673 m.8673 type:complete len:481 (+) comp5383_c0_seq1:269-1711(+)
MMMAMTHRTVATTARALRRGTARSGLLIRCCMASQATSQPRLPSLPFDRWAESPQDTKINTANRCVQADIDGALKLYNEYLEYRSQLDATQQRREELGKIAKDLKRTDPKFKQVVEEGRAEKAKAKELQATATEIELQMIDVGLKIPNDTHIDVPVGDELKATVLAQYGTKPEFDFTPKDHMAINEHHELVDFSAGGVVSGSRFYFLKNEGALLEMALCNYAFNFMSARGYTPMTTPDVVRTHIAERCGFQPRGEGSHSYILDEAQGDGAGTLCLAGTAEIPLAGMLMNATLTEGHSGPLKQKFVGIGHAFRREASGGADGSGLYRVHQFTKVELFAVCRGTTEVSYELHDEILQDQVDFFRSLGLHFRVLDMPTEELGASAHRKYDIEAWLPGKGVYGEISSTSNCTDYQTRRFHTQIHSNAMPQPLTFAHTLNGTACAVPRMIVAIVESFQTSDGSFRIPKALQPFLPSTFFTQDRFI